MIHVTYYVHCVFLCEGGREGRNGGREGIMCRRKEGRERKTVK